MGEEKIRRIEDHVRHAMSSPLAPDLGIAHDFKHVDRVRRWALEIAANEGFEDLKLVEATALLHDIGLAHVKERSQHAQVGAEVSARFLKEKHLFTHQEVKAITDAIRCHSSPDGGGMLGEILRDADKLDALGAMGLMRAFTSKYAKPEYDPRDVKSVTWGLTMKGFEKRFAEGEGIGDYIIDQVNFQIGFYSDLKTKAAQRIANPLVEFMRAFVIQLESEVNRGDG
jgi:HD superfamily phosphodiesterase